MKMSNIGYKSEMVEVKTYFWCTLCSAHTNEIKGKFSQDID